MPRAKKTAKAKEFFIKGKQDITDPDAPVISDEFVDIRGGNEYRGQTIEVRSDTHLEDDRGVGDPIYLKGFLFALNPEEFNKREYSAQEVFDMFSRGIESMLWTDGLSVDKDLAPTVTYKNQRTHVLITVWAKPRHAILDKTKTLSEIARETRTNSNQV